MMRQVFLFILFAGLCHGVSKASECTGRGRYPNDDVQDCRGYTMCLVGGVNGFTQYKLTCPAGFVYSHLEYQCTNATNYQCLPSFTCNVTGKFENDLSKNCSSYVACPEGISGVMTARQVECPFDQVFNPIKADCVNSTEFKCNVGMEQTRVPETLTEAPPVSHNTTDISVHVSGENGFQLSSNVPMNSAVDICIKRILMFVALIFVIYK